jgi:DNA-binding MarR family transcriptional regulator
MKAMDKTELIENILKTADKLFRKLLPSAPEELLTLDITMPQMKIMLILYLHGSMRMTDIASGLNVTLPTATSLVDKLVEKNYLVRETQTDDRRVVLCLLSPEGQSAFAKIWESAANRSRQLLSIMEEDQVRLFSELLESMLESAETDSNKNIVSTKTQVKR